MPQPCHTTSVQVSRRVPYGFKGDKALAPRLDRIDGWRAALALHDGERKMNQVRRASGFGRYKAEADASAFGAATVRERGASREANPSGD